MNVASDFSILIVDDEKSNLEILSKILQSNHTVYIAKSGETALMRAEKDNPDLILLDIVMPDMDGFEVLSRLKGNDATRNIPVIFITGLDSVKDEERGFFLGAVDYITKPFHASIVKARVKTHLKIVKQMRTIERFGLTDSLTELPNRRSFDNQLNIEWGRAVRENKPVSLLMMDIDNFKVYNDTYGHPQGDILLKTVADIFVSTLKRTTDLVFRWGGEEFTVLLPDTGMHGAMTVAEKIRANVEAAVVPRLDNGEPTRVTISIGVESVTQFSGISAEDFLQASDHALYTAKESGRNQVVFNTKGTVCSEKY